jgi:hypothetical protein
MSAVAATGQSGQQVGGGRARVFRSLDRILTGLVGLAGWGAVLGRAVAAGVKMGVGIVMVVIGVFAALRS